MTCRTAFRFLLFFSLLACAASLLSPRPTLADASHARVIRLSLVQGDVRFTREAKGDPLADSKAVWEAAQANLPIRQGYVVSTDNGRAEVEFENGAMAFLNENTVLDFYDLSLEDGARTTRLVLRQGSASFYVNPASGDYFSVTGGDFTVEANGKASFRVNNFDDGSNVNVVTGHIAVLHKKETTALSKGQSLSMKAGQDEVSIERAQATDEFDQWVSGRVDTVSSATNSSLQYTNAASYAPGFADLWTYGNWFSCGSYGLGWQPFGAGFGFNPFNNGQWFWDPGAGWSFASFQPWGWAPYHYGGWLFDASCGGWFYSPPPFYGTGYGVPGNPRKPVVPIVHPPHPPLYRASTAMFVRQGGQLGVVPMNPSDKEGKTPLNLEHGVFSFANSPRAVEAAAGGAGQRWEPVKSPARDAVNSGLVATSAPGRVSRTLIEGSNGTRVVSLGQNSSIMYDPREHRFVNTNASVAAAATSGGMVEKTVPGATAGGKNTLVSDRANNAPATSRVATVQSTRAAVPPRSVPNPPAPRVANSGGGSRGSFESGGSSRGGTSAASGSSASHASAPSAPSGGGGRPH
jgi:hypothetical protein